MKHKTRAIGKWHGLQNDIQQSFDSLSKLPKQPRQLRRWSVDRNLMVTSWEVLQ